MVRRCFSRKYDNAPMQRAIFHHGPCSMRIEISNRHAWMQRLNRPITLSIIVESSGAERISPRIHCAVAAGITHASCNAGDFALRDGSGNPSAGASLTRIA
jgi:hypothetical protein